MELGSYTASPWPAWYHAKMDERPKWLTWRAVMMATVAPAANVWAVLQAENTALRARVAELQAQAGTISELLP